MQRWQYPLTAIPALAVPVIAYALAALFAGEKPFARTLAEIALSLPMPVGVRWEISWADGFALAGLSCLFADLLKSTSTGGAAVVNHMLSVALLIICLLLFLFGPAFVTSTFFLLMAMSALDIVAGFTITTISARRDVATETT
jgi:hypothetical protein